VALLQADVADPAILRDQVYDRAVPVVDDDQFSGGVILAQEIPDRLLNEWGSVCMMQLAKGTIKTPTCALFLDLTGGGCSQNNIQVIARTSHLTITG
jgi:hypothetical protein